MRSPRGIPHALSGSDVPDGRRLLVHSCEDCACPVSHVEPEPAPRDVLPSDALARARDVLAIPLDDEHHALFGPHGNGGVVVVNEAARALLDDLAEPACLSDLVDAGHDPEPAHAVLTRLLGADLVHPPGAPPTPRFRASRELTVWLHVTNACNLACPYCYVDKSREAMDEATATETVDALVASAVEHGFTSLRLKYAGGEASLNATVLFALHDHALARCTAAGLRLSAVLLSNGVAIPDRLARELAAREIAVMVSLDGIGAAHDAQRPTLNGRGSFAMVERSIERLRAAGVAPHLSITITGRNVADIAPVVRFALERELTFSFNFFRDNACAAGADGLQYEEQAMTDGLRSAFAVIEELLPPWSVLGSVLDRGQLLQPRQKACGVGDDYVVVDQHGRIAQCHMELGTTLGDVRHVDPVRAVRADGAPIRNLLVDDKAGCRDCTWRHWCSGGCAVATFAATGRFDVRSPNCRIYKTIYPEAVRLEGLRLLAFARTP
jgi:uncharacterized protein